MRTALPSLALALAVARAAHAQPAAAPSVRPVAVFDLAGGRGDRGLPSSLVIADSAGMLVARYATADDPWPRPMLVDVERTDLVLSADTPHGALEVVLYGRNDDARGTVVGRWALGAREGELRVRRRS